MQRMETTIPKLVRAAAQRYGDATAIEDTGEEGTVRFSFRELETESLRAARAFIAQGVERGDRVAIWAPNLHDWIIAALGIQSAGAVLVTLNTRLKGPEAAYILRTSGARVLCTMGDFLGSDYAKMIAGEDLPALEEIVVFRGEASSGMRWTDFLARGEAIDEAVARERAESVEPGDLSDILFTSGTTGQPKGVMTAHEQNIRAFEVWTEVVGLRETDRYLIVNPFFHSFGYKGGWLSCLIRGATALPQRVFDVPDVLERIGRDRISVLPGPPTLYQSILVHPDRERF
ncbi:MAG: AMP-binding protein, partial [Gemmatimonadota bacterium]|nr:AMP-binding protein [Gemmatimonadota bacterium]